jgi:hypothetical protein
VGADPGGLLAPATPTPASANTNTNAARSESEETARSQPEVSSGGAAAVPVQPAAASGTAEAEAQAEAGAATGAAASRQRSEPAVAEGASRRAQSAQAASAAGAAAPVARAAAAASVGEASGEGAGRGEGEPPSGNPKKPLLAAAGIAGVVLLAVPLLIWATNDDSEKKKDTVSVAANSDTMLNDAPLNAPPGDYAPSKPTAAPTTTKPSAEAKAKAKPSIPAQVVVPPPPVPQPKAKAPVAKSTPAKEETYKPPPNTASLAVQRLATKSPGRHICYRAYVKGLGWQGAVCDGGTAGTTGQNRPIQALNIAVSDTNGTAGNGFIQVAGWKTPWSSAVNGVDMYIGSAKKDAPNMAGFTIRVGAGVVCQNTYVRNEKWRGLGCDNPGGEGYIFGGTLNKELWLEAVRFTV